MQPPTQTAFDSSPLPPNFFQTPVYKPLSFHPRCPRTQGAFPLCSGTPANSEYTMWSPRLSPQVACRWAHSTDFLDLDRKAEHRRYFGFQRLSGAFTASHHWWVRLHSLLYAVSERWTLRKGSKASISDRSRSSWCTLVSYPRWFIHTFRSGLSCQDLWWCFPQRSIALAVWLLHWVEAALCRLC